MIPAPLSHDENRLTVNREQAISPSAASLRWDSEAIVLHGDDRAELRRRVQELADFLARTPGVELKDLAYTLNTALAPGGSRLALVAESVADLQARLDQAAKRLADPRCRSIKDSRGCYFFEQPLHGQGKLAVFFPGEGSQYLNMLGGLLPHFPEVRDHFARCDELSQRAGGRDEPISRHIFVPTSLSDAERGAAEKNLWRLGNAVSSILISEWALYLLLRELGVQPDVIGGHSAGEFSALLAAGCIEPDDFFIEQLFALSQVLQGQEDDGSLAEITLLAVAAGRSAVLEAIGPDAGVFVAMDNCPHQTVVACPPAAAAVVEERLSGRGVVCERLPFRRPYHTPLFEPFLGPIARMYERLTVRPPRLGLYSCTTGQPFPNDPAAIRRLAVSHWASPVEFIRLAETLYADGVRLFVECGPRGNLTSFLQDILRGRSFEAVAINLAHRSGLSQLNHMVALLAAHHVPLRFEHLYLRRSPRSISWERSEEPPSGESLIQKPLSPGVPGERGWGEGERNAPLTPNLSPLSTGERGADRTGSELRSDRQADAPRSDVNSTSARAAVMQQYLGVMEQFLDTEREVLEQYLARRRGAPAVHPPVWPLLGEILRHEPGQELVLRRAMDLKEDLYASDHTLGARDASTIDPTQHGLPFMPMAFSLEMMAEAAAFLLPGRTVIGLKRVRLQRWIPFDDEPITLELTARVHREDPSAVAIEIRDLGNAIRPGNSDSPAVVGTVLLGMRYPEPPPPEEFPLTHEGPCRYTAHQLYAGERRLFHGPLFEALESTDRQGDEGIEGHLRTLPHSGLFASTPEPDLILDPLLVDASTHLLGSWHLGQPDQTGRVVLPYELGSVTLYGPRPATGTRIKCRVRVENGSARQVSHRIDLIGPDDRLWCRLAPAEYWRFYWPLEYVDFFRFKDRFLLARDWPTNLTAAKQAGRCVRLDPPSDLCQPVHRMALARITLTRSEWKVFRFLNLPDDQITNWLFGRIAAKDAIRSLWFERHGQRLFPADIELGADTYSRIVPSYRGTALAEGLPAVSFAHAPGVSTALAAFVPHAGIALHRLSARRTAATEDSFDPAERALLDTFGPDGGEWRERFLAARAALANALGPKLADDPRDIVIRKVDRATGRILAALGPRLLEAYPEYRLDLLAVHTVRDGELIVATTFCERDHP
jgi:malonyl CoA-acyl carrier protein transacylase